MNCPHGIDRSRFRCDQCERLLAVERERRATLARTAPPTWQESIAEAMTPVEFMRFAGPNASQATIDALRRSGLGDPLDLAAAQWQALRAQLPGVNAGPIPDGSAPKLESKREVIVIRCGVCLRRQKDCICAEDPESWARPPT